MDHDYEYRLENVYLRPLRHSDIEHLRIWRNNPANTEFLNKIPYITEEMQESWFQKYLNDTDELTFAIVEDQVLHRIVGSLSLCNFGQNSVELGKVMVGDVAAHGMKVGANASKAAAIIAHEAIYCLNRPHTGIYLPTMVWKDMYDFSSDSVLLVLASTHYNPNEYIRDYNEFVEEIRKGG